MEQKRTAELKQIEKKQRTQISRETHKSKNDVRNEESEQKEMVSTATEVVFGSKHVNFSNEETATEPEQTNVTEEAKTQPEQANSPKKTAITMKEEKTEVGNAKRSKVNFVELGDHNISEDRKTAMVSGALGWF